MGERIYVALDLETTGLDAGTDAIIEIGAVRFACSPATGDFRLLDHFVTFVNPKRPIPLRIQQLTGIRDADVADAPFIHAAIPELLGFVTREVHGVIAHNAAFDFGFLRAVGIDFHRPTYDTFELASILLPSMSSYSLGELCVRLEIALPDAHRALDDATATAMLFSKLLERLVALPQPTVQTLLACGRDTDWPPLLLLQSHVVEPGNWTLPEFAPEPPTVSAALPTYQDVVADAPESLLSDQGPRLAEVDRAELEAIFMPGGALNQMLDNLYEPRPGQAAMAGRVLNALNSGDHLLVEAGTGTGKSLAYLLPASLWSLANLRRVVVATNTIPLQDQLLEKDIPTVQALLAATGREPLRAALLKGRGNYLCTRRLHAWYRNRQLSALELRVLARVLVWLSTTRSGDVSDLFLPTAAERGVWRQICSDAATCSLTRCSAPIAPGSDACYYDFFLHARTRAEAAHLLIVNHALLLSDIASGGRVLPPYSHLVVDETHRLEEAATEHWTYRVDWRLTRLVLGRMAAEGDLWSRLARVAADYAGHETQTSVLAIAATAHKASTELDRFSRSLTTFARTYEALRQDCNYTQRVGLAGQVRSQPGWGELEIEWDLASQPLRDLCAGLAALLGRIRTSQTRLDDQAAAVLAEVKEVEEWVCDLVKWMDAIVFHPGDEHDTEHVSWLEVTDNRQEATLAAAPLYVSDRIEREIVHKKRAAIFTGATLRTGSGFSFIRDRLGLWDVPASTVESPFDYRKSTLLYMPSDMPEPNHSYYQQAVEQAIQRAATATGGRTLALFTSFGHLRATADAIRAPLDRHGITVLQHDTGSRRRLLREFRQADKAVLLGTRSFWEGIDLPGDELRCLLIVRLPFAVPSDPLVAARCAVLENAFRDYTLPEAILRFRQGFGRLIRRATDHGVVVVLDSRMWRKEYGQAFRESLPECTVRRAPLANLETEIARWFNQAPGESVGLSRHGV